MMKTETAAALDTLTQAMACCEKCKLHESCASPFMAGNGQWYKPKIAVVGEAPGPVEDQADTPMAGAAYRIVARVLEGCGLNMETDVWLTNAVRCNPHGKTSDKAVKACREFLFKELDAIQPDVVLCLGAASTFAVLELKGIMTLQGSVHHLHIGGKPTPVVPCLAPAFILRDPSRMDDFCDAVEKAVELWKNGGKVVRTPVDYRVIKTEEDLATVAREISATEILSWDIETTGTDPWAPDAAVVCVALSTAPNTGWLLLLDHVATDSACQVPRPRRLEWLRWALESSPAALFGQNLKFDMGYVRANLGINPRRPAFDAYLAHHLLDEEGSKNQANSLKNMARKYTDMGDYEQAAILAAGSSMAFYKNMRTAPLFATGEASTLVPQPITQEQTLTHYACSDTDAVLRIAAELMPRLEAENLLPVLNLELHKTMMLTDLEYNGAAIDWEYHASLQQAFPQQLETTLATVRAYPQVRLAERYHAQRKGKVLAPDEAPEPFNVNSPPQVGTLVFDVLGLPAVGKKTKAGKDSTGKDNVAEWLEMLEPGSDAANILQTLQDYKQLSKLNSSYVQSLPEYRGRDGRVHTRFNQGLVATWRLSSQDPNLQQLPRNDGHNAEDPDAIGKGSIKRLFVGGQPGWWVAEADYSQIELRIAGLISQDAGFLDNYDRGEDLHTRTAAGIYRVAPEDVTPQQRTFSKIINFGILYGMDEYGLSRRLRVSKAEAIKMIRAFWLAYPGFDQWVKDTARFLRQHQYVESMFGHRRHLPNVTAPDEHLAAHAERQGINFPIQCTASNLTMYAETFIQEIFRQEGMRTYCFGQVHDSIWLTGPPEEKATALGLVQTVMENPGFEFLIGADPRWPRPVPIKADVKVGSNLRDLAEWQP